MTPGASVATGTTGQAWSADDYMANASFVPALGAGVMDWLAPQAGERILDLGCGDGALTVKLADAGADVVGVDASDDLLAKARSRGLDVQLVDGQRLPFDAQFDAVFSNAALHWMPDAASVVDGIFRALKPGGRFVAELGGHGNVASIVTALLAVGERYRIDPALANPWFFPTVDEYRDLLEAQDFVVDDIVLIPRPTPLPGDVTAWLKTFRTPYFDAAGKDAGRAMADLKRLLAPALEDSSGRWTADYVRLRVRARRVS